MGRLSLALEELQLLQRRAADLWVLADFHVLKFSLQDS